MYNGNQVLRFDTKYKASDLGGLSVELTKRKGTGNYDEARTNFNKEYQILDKNLASKVYSTLKENNVEYGENKKNINLVNGAIITSGPEFFESLGMNFKDSGRVKLNKLKEYEQILVPDITSENDIPIKVKEFFEDSYNFLADYVGKENVVYAVVHYDEDTPHMHFYFTPVVENVKRKVFEVDTDNNIVKKLIFDKNGNEKLVPVQKKDSCGKNVYELKKGKFLNSDQFWKNKGGKSSFAKVQDNYNDFINSKGFNLYRGEIGANKHHTTKLEFKYNSLKEQTSKIEKEYKHTLSINELEVNTHNQINNVNKDISLSKRKLIGYKEKDVEELIDNSIKINKENILNINQIKKQDLEINKLKQDITEIKNGTTIEEKEKIIESQNKIITKQKNLINSLKNEIDELKFKIESITHNFTELLKKSYKALGKILKINKNPNDFDYFENIVDETNYKDNNNDLEL